MAPRIGAPGRQPGEFPAPLTPEDELSFESGIPNIARVYDALLGGKDNYAVDREAALALAAAIPGAAQAARDNRAFLGRAVRYLADREGITQFLDIGTGLPTQGAVHEIAQEVSPDARVVYADNDRVVVAHATALLGQAPGVIAVEGDVRYPRHLLTTPAVRDHLDLTRPVAVLMVAVLHFVADLYDPRDAVTTLTGQLAPGSYLVLSHVTGDQLPDDAVTRAREIYRGAYVEGTARSRDEIARFFGGLDLVPPGLVDVAAWRPDLDPPGGPPGPAGQPVLFWAGIGRTPGSTGTGPP
jgi:hypothetical protein